jgi:XTP/dITP diphosphohydrolase
MRLLIATTNPDKLREIRELLAGMPVQLMTLHDLPPLAEPEETGETFEENARLKARYYAAHAPWMTVAEDSGLVIDALGGEPGVRSARFVRPDAGYPERFAEIERRLAADHGRARTARFVCALAVAQGDRVVFETRGVVEGEIVREARGAGGFGYDPIFYYPPFRKTLAEVSAPQKLAVAHRGHAFRALAAWLRRLTEEPGEPG